jgi:hypothetical protein
MPNAVTKTVKDHLRDAEEIIRRLNAEAVVYRREIKQLQREEDTAEAIRKEIFAIAAHDPEPPEWLTGKSGKIGARGTPMTIWSDWHASEVVKGAQINYVNEFNSAICKQRAFRLFDTTVDLSYNHMGRAKTQYPGIIVMLGGDMIGGNIHEELAWTNDRTPHQAVNDCTDLIGAGLEKMASAFGKVYVPAVVGNHGRSTKFSHYKDRVFHNYDWSIYCNLIRYFQKEKRIRFLVPDGADATVKSYGMRYFLTHGDDLGVKGGDGIIGAIGPIVRGTLKIGAQQAQMGQDFDIACICHWHQMLWLPRAIVNNALKGPDEYSMLKLRAPAMHPSQALWFNHPEWGITARWEVFLEGQKLANEDSHKHWVSWQG